MTSLLKAQERAQRLLEGRQKNTEEKLKEDISEIFSDTESSLTERAQILSKSIGQTALSLRKEDTKAAAEISEQIKTSKESLKAQQSEATDEISEQIKTSKEQLLKEHIQALSELQIAHKQQVESLQASLKESTLLSQEVANQAQLKKALFTSNIVLISIVFILLISAICLGFINRSKLSEQQAKEARLQQIEAITQQKVREYNQLISAIYKVRNGK